MPHITATKVSTSAEISVSVVSSPLSIASTRARRTNVLAAFSELFSLRPSSGWRWASSNDVVRNAAAERSIESTCIAAEKNAESRSNRDVFTRLDHALGNKHLVGLLDDFVVQHPFVGEVVIDCWSGEVGADRDCLKCRRIVTKLAEYLACC